jgi:hypothetical protein
MKFIVIRVWSALVFGKSLATHLAYRGRQNISCFQFIKVRAAKPSKLYLSAKGLVFINTGGRGCILL